LECLPEGRRAVMPYLFENYALDADRLELKAAGRSPYRPKSSTFSLIAKVAS
jgi:hypothetical protein